MKRALVFSLLGFICVMGALCVAAVSCRANSAAVVPPAPENAELLACNSVRARFTGVQTLPCRFMTALCPHRCDHATRLASFEVLENLAYAKHGEYGDAKLSPGDTAVVDVQKPILGQPADIPQRIAQLKPGDVVKLTICHYYVKQEQGHFPVRPAVLMERVSD